MIRLMCEACGTKKKKIAGVRLLSGGRNVNTIEPDEWERVIWGRAKVPKPQQRVLVIGAYPGEPKKLDVSHYDCDDCGEKIWPGDRCVAWTVWVEGRGFIEGDEPEVWEDGYVERE